MSDSDLEEILRSEFKVNDHDDCSKDCGKRHYADEAFERATQAIKQLLDKAIVNGRVEAELEALDWAHTQLQLTDTPQTLKIIQDRIKRINQLSKGTGE